MATKSSRSRRMALLRGSILPWAILVLCGCGGGRDPKLPVTVPVSGKVSLPSGPLETGTITFHPVDGTGNPADGRLLAGGAFELSTYKNGDGAILGKHKVTIQIPPRLDGEKPSAVIAVPPEYTSPRETPLSAEVTSSGNNHFEFAVTATKPR